MVQIPTTLPVGSSSTAAGVPGEELIERFPSGGAGASVSSPDGASSAGGGINSQGGINSINSGGGGGGGGAGVGGGGLDWELDGANLELCRRDDGSPWQLGQGENLCRSLRTLACSVNAMFHWCTADVGQGEPFSLCLRTLCLDAASASSLIYQRPLESLSQAKRVVQTAIESIPIWRSLWSLKAAAGSRTLIVYAG